MNEFCKSVNKQLNEIIKNEKYLNDIDPDMSPSELKSVLSLERGESMLIFIKRYDEKLLSFIVPSKGTLEDLKKVMRAQMKRTMKHERINWKYVWKNYCLTHRHEQLVQNKKKLKDYDIEHKSQLNFSKIYHSSSSRNKNKSAEHFFQ